MPRKIHTKPITICFVLMFVFLFYSLHSFSSFFFALALALKPYEAHAFNSNSMVLKWWKTANAHLAPHWMCMPPSDKHRMLNTLGAVYALFYLIWFNSIFFFLICVCTAILYRRKHEGMTISGFSWYLHPKKIGSIS